MKTDGVAGGGLALDALDGLIYIADYLVDAGDDDDLPRAVADGGDAVGVAVHIIKLAVFGNGVGRSKKVIAKEA